MGLDGRLYATTLSVTTSIAHYGANPNMPFFMRNTPKPYGSLVAYDPASFLDYFKELVAWHGALLRGGEQAPGQAASLAALHLSLEEALAAGELPQGQYDELRGAGYGSAIQPRRLRSLAGGGCLGGRVGDVARRFLLA